MSEQWKPRVTVAAVIERENKFLIVEEEIDGKIVLNQPAGHWEDGETLIEAVIRETREETGWLFSPEAIIGIYHWRHPRSGDTYLRFAFCGEISDYNANQPLDDGIVAANWYTKEELQKRGAQHRSPQLMLCIEEYQRGIRVPLDIITTVTS
ncbi:MAG: NUDIX hydrolase [Gammaproteobacteria bacterium]|nr:NUDIX hydrolase [Gammaproteobacteria bacterium]